MSDTPSFKQLFDPVLVELKQVEADIFAGDLAAAATRLNQLQNKSADDPRIFMTGVMLAERAGNPAGALQVAERAVKLAPNWAPAAIELAGVLARQGEAERALAEARRAVILAPQALAILEPATSIANIVGDAEAASTFLDLAALAAPDKISIRMSRGYNLLERQKFDDAWRVFAALVDAEPANELALLGRGRAALGKQDRDAALADFTALQALVPSNESYAYYADIAAGRTPRSQPSAITQSTFDGYALRFDKHLVGALKYRVPKRVAEIITARHPSLQVSVLDLGCGTGLVGVYLGKPASGLVGVDLSANMIAEAAKHNLYDRFHQVSLVDALRDSPSAEFDVITAADVFIYVGDIAQVLKDARRVLRVGGSLVFSCEATIAGEADLVLHASQRFAHSQASVQLMCEAAGFTRIEIEPFDIRNEGGVPVVGYIVHAST